MERFVSSPPPEITFSLPLVVDPRLSTPAVQIEKLARVYARAQQRPQFAPAYGEGDFEILRWVGSGPHGTVYRARQLTLNRPIVLKVFAQEPAGTVASALPEHEHIVRVYSEAFDPVRGLRFLTMQYVAGLSLAQLTRVLGERRLSGGDELLAVIEESVDTPLVFSPSFARERAWLTGSRFDDAIARIGARLADALDFAHRHGVAHRNLKPENILIDGYGRPYLTDFAPRRGQQMWIGEGGISWAAQPIEIDQQRAREAFNREEGREDVRQLWELLSEFYRRHGAPMPVRASRNALPAVTLAEVAPEDTASAPQWRASLESFEQLRSLQAAMPPLGFWMRLASRWPIVTLCSFRILPHLVGTVVCAAYCTLRPGLPLTFEQREIMQHALHVYESICWPAGIGAVLLLVWGLSRQFLSRGRAPVALGRASANGALDPRLAELRRRALLLPWRLALVNSSTWLPSIVVFSALSYHLTGRFHPSGFIHFALAVIMAYWISTAYSTLYALFFSIQLLYPRFLEPRPDLRVYAARELRAVRGLLRWLPLSMAAIPLTAAFLLLQDGPGDFLPERLRMIQGFLLVLIVGGAGGFLFSLAAIQRLATTVRAICGHSHPHRGID